MQKLILLTKVVVLILYTSIASADVLFEGYYKLTQASNHIGYFIQRYELDPAAKTFTSTYYFYSKDDQGGSTTESLTAKSTSKLEPVSYSYSRLESTASSKSLKAIDASVRTVGKKSKLAVKVVENGKPPKISEILLDDKIFLSTFLTHLVLKDPKGLQAGNKFSYQAIAEEDGKIESGQVFVKEQVKEMGMDAFRTLNTFKGDEFISWVNAKGEAIKTSVPKLSLQAQLVATPKEAYANMPFSENIIKTLFGNIPEGKKNMLNGK